MKKPLFSAILTFVLIAAQVGTVFAQDTTSATGTVQAITIETDATTGDTTVLVSYADDTGATQTVRLSMATAEGLGLVTTTTITDPLTGETKTEVAVNDGVVGTEITIDPATVIADTTSEEAQHPVGSTLSDFFSSLLGVDYDTIMSYHNGDEGYVVGFGVIAQALWITNDLGGDTTTFTALLDAKMSGNYENITLADGSTPDNWGDVVKSIKKGENLGYIKSGRTDNNTNPTSTDHGNAKGNNMNPTSTDHGNAKGNNTDATSADQNNGNGNNSNGHGGGGGNGNGNGGGHP